MIGKRFKQVLKDFEAAGFDFRINDLNEAVEAWIPEDDEWLIMDKTVKAVVRTELRELGYGVQGRGKPGVEALKDAWTTLAHQQRYNPIKDYFTELRKLEYEPELVDGIPQKKLITEFCIKYFENPDTMFSNWQFRWMAGAIAKLFKQERNPILVIGGEQDKGKSTYVRWLCPDLEYFREGQIKPDSKDEVLRLSDIFIQEVPELGSSTKRQNVDSFKEHITRKSIVERPAYGDTPLKKTAICSFVATVNPDGAGFLIDTTGSTRFLICEVNQIDFAYEKEDAHQLWREALWFYDNTYRAWELTPWEKERRQEINATYQMVNALEDIIDQYLELTKGEDDWMATIQIRAHLSPYYRISNENGFTRELSRILKSKGLDRVREPFRKGKPHRWGWLGIKKRETIE